MPTTYMMIWSIVFIFVAGLFRGRSTGRLMRVVLLSIIITGISHLIFTELSLAAGLDPQATILPSDYLARGPIAWAALLVMPFGWIGPVISLHVMQGSIHQAQAQFQ